MKESCAVKISAFVLYRFFRNGLPAMPSAVAAGVLVLCVLACVVFSPGFSFRRADEGVVKPPAISVSETPTEIGTLRDSEPLFLPTRWNFGADTVPEELDLHETSFLPFGGIIFLGIDAESTVTLLKNTQEPPSPEAALGADAWKIATGFGTDPQVPAGIKSSAGTAVRIVDESTGTEFFSGELSEIERDDEPEKLLSPSEFICGISAGYSEPSVIAVKSCGDAERDRRVAAAISKLLHSRFPGRGLYRIFVD